MGVYGVRQNARAAQALQALPPTPAAGIEVPPFIEFETKKAVIVPNRKKRNPRIHLWVSKFFTIQFSSFVSAVWISPDTVKSRHFIVVASRRITRPSANAIGAQAS